MQLAPVEGELLTSSVMVKDLNSTYWGAYDIPPLARTSVSVDLMMLPEIMPKAGAEIELDIGIIDQFGNEHWVEGVPLRSS